MQLLHGDCLEVMKTLDDNSVDAIVTDPPYGTTACKWDSVIPLELMWEELKRIAKPNAAIVMFSSQPFTTALNASNLPMFRYDIIWQKPRATGGLNANRMPLRNHEHISVFYKKLPTYNAQKFSYQSSRFKIGQRNPITGSKHRGDGEDLYSPTDRNNWIETGDRYPLSVVYCSNVPHNGKHVTKNLHPTQKPVALMEYLIKTYTNEGDTVLDFTMGSGTTGVAAVNLGRRFVGIELDPNYFAIATERIKAAADDKATPDQPTLFAEEVTPW